jgi:hypothetical protein
MTRPKNNRPASSASSLVARRRKELGRDVAFTEAFRKISCGQTAIVAYLRLEVKKTLKLGRRTSKLGDVGRRRGPYERTLPRIGCSAAEPRTTH